MQIIYPVSGGSIKLSRVFVGSRSVDEAVEDAVLEAAEKDRDLTVPGKSAIMSEQNVCPSASGKEGRT